jgi:dTDP-alpha-D-glucose dehydrogenase
MSHAPIRPHNRLQRPWDSSASEEPLTVNGLGSLCGRTTYTQTVRLDAKQSQTVGVVGFGYIGAVIGAVLADHGHRVFGLDPNPRVLERVAQGLSPVPEPGLGELIARHIRSGLLSIGDDAAVVAQCDVVLLAVGTPLTAAGDADTAQLISAAKSVAPHLHHGQTVMVKSTVPPGTTANVLAPLLRQSATVHVAFSPERLAEGRAVQEFQTIPIVVGGVDMASTTAGADFWRNALNVEVIEIDGSLGAELVKLADNLWIDLNIALANELAQLADRLGGVDVLEVIRAANTLPKLDHHVNILLPSIGVGGYCLTKDPWFVHALGRRFGLDLRTPQVSREVNDGMPAYTADLIDRTLRDSASGKRVAVLGVAFKTDTGDYRFTPTVPVIERLMALGYEVVVHDPFVIDDDGELGLPLPLNPDLEATVTGADCVAYFTGHRPFHEIDIAWLAERMNPPGLIFDGRMYFSREQIAVIEANGLRFKGVGR